MNITITDMRALDGDSLVAVHVLIVSEDGMRDARVYHILPAQYAALRLRPGEIDCGVVDALERAAELCRAIRKGVQLLSYGRQSERTLNQKLRARGFSPAVAAEAASYLRRQGLFEEGADAMRVAQACRRKHWGMRRILSHLHDKGYPEAILREVQEQLREDDFVPDCADLIRIKYGGAPGDREEKQKMIAALLRYGYSLGEIHRAFELVMQEDEE